MIARQFRVAVLCAVAGCARAPAHQLDPHSLPLGPAALVRGRREALFVFPAPDSLRPCGYRRPTDAHLRLYSWTVNVSGPARTPWYAIDVWPAVPDSVGPSPPLATVLRAARPLVVTVAGEPPMSSGVVDSTTAVEAHAVGSGRVVVRLTRPATVARLFGARPSAVRFVACHDGDDRWTRSVPVRYEP